MPYLSLKNIHKTILITSLLLLAACSRSPVSIEVQPELTFNPSVPPLTTPTVWSIASQDQRIAQYLIEISSGNGAATLINESQSSRLIIEKALQEQWWKHGLKFNALSINKIDIQLIKLLAKVKQNTLTHEINSQIVIQVKLTTEDKIFSKAFRSRVAQEAPFSADSKKISAQLNTQLSQLLNEIIKDPELNAKLQQF